MELRSTVGRLIKSIILDALMGFALCMCSVNGRSYGTVETVEIHSDLLGKPMRASVHLPDGYSEETQYPVLYFVPYVGGGPGIITQTTSSQPECIRVLRSDAVNAMIVVGVPHDGSFLLDCDRPCDNLTLVSGITLHKGLYESFFLLELIPEIERRYSIRTDRSARYIGGYSMGGHAALRIALTHPELFSRVGAHSPTLFTGSLPDPDVERLLYPNADTRKLRDPLQIVLTADISNSCSFYLDTGSGDINRSACDLLYERLLQRGAHVQYHLLSGYHGTSYLADHMSEYLEFYGKRTQ